MGFISYCLSLSLYIMSSFLMRYSVLYELNTLDAGRSRSMCGVIVVDVGRSRSTSLGRDANISIIAFHIVIIIRPSINCPTIICLPIVCYFQERSL